MNLGTDHLFRRIVLAASHGPMTLGKSAVARSGQLRSPKTLTSLFVVLNMFQWGGLVLPRILAV